MLPNGTMLHALLVIHLALVFRMSKATIFLSSECLTHRDREGDTQGQMTVRLPLSLLIKTQACLLLPTVLQDERIAHTDPELERCLTIM